MARVGIIGTGWGARVQVPAFRKAGHEIRAIAGSNRDKTAQIAKDLGIEAFATWREVVESPEVDLVTIVTPPLHHAEISLAALAAGKHVVCEKPTAMHAGEAEEMLRAAERHPTQLALLDHELRFLPSWRAARVKMKELGAPRYVEIRYSSPSRGDRSRAWNWWSDAAAGGGVLGAIGSHLVDACRYFIGEVDAVQATLHTFIPDRPFGDSKRRVTSDDFATTNLLFKNRALAAMTMSVVASVDESTSLTIHGEEGGLRLCDADAWFATRAGAWKRIVEGESKRETGDSPGGMFGTATVYFAHALADALDRGSLSVLEPAATFRDGLAQQRILDAAHRSHANGGRWERIG